MSKKTRLEFEIDIDDYNLMVSRFRHHETLETLSFNFSMNIWEYENYEHGFIEKGSSIDDLCQEAGFLYQKLEEREEFDIDELYG